MKVDDLEWHLDNDMPVSIPEPAAWSRQFLMACEEGHACAHGNEPQTIKGQKTLLDCCQSSRSWPLASRWEDLYVAVLGRSWQNSALQLVEPHSQCGADHGGT